MKVRNNWKVEKENVLSMSKAGKTLQEIGDLYGVTKEQIRQVLAKYYPGVSASERGSAVRVRESRLKKQEEQTKRTGRVSWKHEDDLSRAMSQCFIRKKQNARYGKWGWSIKKQDVDFPLLCPMLGIPIDWFAEFRADNSPSFDRLDNTKGYIPGNVIICSWRANRIKNDGTAEEHEKIALFLKQTNQP